MCVFYLVDDHDVVAAGQEGVGHPAADEPSSARDQDGFLPGVGRHLTTGGEGEKDTRTSTKKRKRMSAGFTSNRPTHGTRAESTLETTLFGLSTRKIAALCASARKRVDHEENIDRSALDDPEGINP